MFDPCKYSRRTLCSIRLKLIPTVIYFFLLVASFKVQPLSESYLGRDRWQKMTIFAPGAGSAPIAELGVHKWGHKQCIGVHKEMVLMDVSDFLPCNVAFLFWTSLVLGVAHNVLDNADVDDLICWFWRFYDGHSRRRLWRRVRVPVDNSWRTYYKFCMIQMKKVDRLSKSVWHRLYR